MEIGCNCGRNLFWLDKAGYKELYGIEAFDGAIELMQEKFPHIHSEDKIKHGLIENLIKDIPDKAFDLVFTMAVLLHIHPQSEWIFKHIGRIARKHIITCELESDLGGGNEKGKARWARNYEEIFGEFGWDCINVIEGERLDEALGYCLNYKLRVFE